MFDFDYKSLAFSQINSELPTSIAELIQDKYELQGLKKTWCLIKFYNSVWSVSGESSPKPLNNNRT